MRYVLLDRITALEPPTRARGVKCVSLADDVFTDHFPGLPLWPGALLLESMAQLAGALLEATVRHQGHGELYAVLTSVGAFQLRRQVVPGDRVELGAEVVGAGGIGGRVRVEATVDGARVTETELGFALGELPEALAARRREQLRIWLGQPLAPA